MIQSLIIFWFGVSQTCVLFSSPNSLRTGPSLLPPQIPHDTVRDVHRGDAVRIQQKGGAAADRGGRADGGINDEAGGGHLQPAGRRPELYGAVPVGEEAGCQGSQGRE